MSARTLLLALANRLDQQPGWPASVFPIRDWARFYGATPDQLGLLPHPPDGATYAEYAARLRELARD